MTDFHRLRARFAATVLLPGSLLAGSVAAFPEKEPPFENETPFDEATLFFELNDTDGDLGFHGFVDGDAWKKLEIEDPNEHTILNVHVRGRLGRQGLTELFFESAEPSFDELPPEKVFKRFPEGTYEIEGFTLDDEELESEVEISHVMPEPAPNIRINGIPAAPNCDADPLPVVSAPVVITWDDVTQSHPTIGKPGDVEVEQYQVFVELLDTDSVASAVLPPEQTTFDVPPSFTSLGSNFKLELLTRAENSNQTATETCFVVE